jgi:medium-chain acyl-[acyl-carrier-protein] hydrolase
VSRWLLRTSSHAGAEVRLFCFPYAGGGASVYRAWAEALEPSIAVYPVQLPGHESRADEPLMDDLRAIAAAAAEALTPLLDRPYALFGHSMGALLAFEVARMLRARGARAPLALIASGHVAPDVPLTRRRLCDLSDEEFVRALTELEGTPREVLEDRALLDFFLPRLRADFAACDRYQCASQPPLDVPIVALGGADDTEEPLAGVIRWEHHTTAGGTFRVMPGGHFFIHPQRKRVIAAVREAIESAQESAIVRKEQHHG